MQQSPSRQSLAVKIYLQQQSDGSIHSQDHRLISIGKNEKIKDQGESNETCKILGDKFALAITYPLPETRIQSENNEKCKVKVQGELALTKGC